MEIEPSEFFSIAEEAIADAFGLPAPTADPPWEWQEERIPNPNKECWGPSQDFDFISFSDYEINNVPSSLSIYRHQANNVQIMLLILVPTEHERSLSQRITYMMEWLKVSDATPSKRRPAASGADF